MEWLKGYYLVTLFFWKDKNTVTIEQFTFLPALYGGIFYATYSKILGNSSPFFSMEEYLFPIISIFVIACYAVCESKSKYVSLFKKLLRIFILQLFLSLLFFVSINPWFPEESNSTMLKSGIAISLLLLLINTLRKYSMVGSNSQVGKVDILYLITAMIFLAVTSWYFSYYFVLPAQ